MKNYLLANFRLRHFKILGSRKFANIQKSMQIRMPFVQKKYFLFVFFQLFLVKWLHHNLLSAHFQIFDTIWPSLMYNSNASFMAYNNLAQLAECRFFPQKSLHPTGGG